MAKVILEVKDDEKTTRYTADTSKMEESAKRVGEQIVSFFEKMFDGVFTKETTPSE